MLGSGLVFLREMGDLTPTFVSLTPTFVTPTFEAPSTESNIPSHTIATNTLESKYGGSTSDLTHSERVKRSMATAKAEPRTV